MKIQLERRLDIYLDTPLIAAAHNNKLDVVKVCV